MKTPEDVINRFINEENVKFNQERDDWVIEAMEEYAKLYHESKVKELNIPAVRCSRLSPEEIFLKDIKSLINNLLIDNPNYKNDYYFKGSYTMNILKLIKDTKNRAKYILERIDDIEHLVKME